MINEKRRALRANYSSDSLYDDPLIRQLNDLHILRDRKLILLGKHPLLDKKGGRNRKKTRKNNSNKLRKTRPRKTRKTRPRKTKTGKIVQ